MRKKILLIEDDENFIKNLQAEFTSEDEQLLIATDGEEGLNKAKEELPDVIVIDVILPKMLGLTILEQLKSDEKTRFIPAILMSNFGGDVNEKRAMELGANEFILKTDVSIKQLADIIRRHFPPLQRQ